MSGEWIVKPIFNEDGFLIGYEKTGEVVRCKDCKWLSMTTIGMDYACWHGAHDVYGETGKDAGKTVCRRIENLDHYCSYGERSDHE